MTKIKLFYIDHPLTTAPHLSEEVLSTFSDDQVEEYSALFDQYQTAQREAASTGHDLASQCRELVKELFNDPTEAYNDSKQVKYFDRMIRNGETCVDIHAVKYPQPVKVQDLVEKAKTRIGNIAKSRVTVGGDDTLQEINNAVTFLMEKGLSLNVDFTVSNAVALASAHVQEDIDIATSDDEGKVSLETYNVLLKDEPFDTTHFCLTGGRGYGSRDYTLQNIALNSEDDDEDVTIRISFTQGVKPTLECK